jgi:phosphopantothenoylcysteine decarboxylase/phosphopantothenate--cysteine ligase
MAEPEEIVKVLAGHFDSKKKLDGKRVLVTAGPTHEAIDPVRFIGNHSSGCSSLFPQTDVTVLAAAVADYKPVARADQKIKKKDETLTLELTKTHDIAASLGKLKHNGQVIVGFALETENELANAMKKLESKNFDLIVLNSLNDKGAGFGADTNKITIINRKREPVTFDLKSKKEVARDIVHAILENLHD